MKLSELTKKIDNLEGDLERVQLVLQDYLRDSQAREPLSTILTELLAGRGKLLRPALVLIMGHFGSAGEKSKELLIRTGAIIEMTHMASLIHDDIVDDSPTRRGRPTIQSRYGKDMAVYVGDYLLSKVLQQLMEPELLPVGRSLSLAISEMVFGELSQYAAQFDLNATPEQYFTNISGKTAALFQAACKAGTIVADCSSEVISAAGFFGQELGIMFQLRDDLIDCIPIPASDGKPQGLDFINGVYTLPVLYAMQFPPHAAALQTLASEAQQLPPERLFPRLHKILDTSGGIAYCQECLQEYRLRSERSLATLPDSPIKIQLIHLLSLLTEL